MAKMKNSGVEWIGEIPEDWDVIRFKDKFRNVKEIAGDKSAEYERLALTLNGVIKRPKDDSEGLQPKEFDGYQILRENDFIFKMIDLQNISTSRVGLSPYTGLVSPAYIRFTAKNKNEYTKYTYFYLMSMYYNCVFNSLGGDGVRSALNASDMGNLNIPFPSKDTQQAIVSAIESKTTKIDSLIANEEKQIEKLKSYKQSLITETVTKGLDKNAKMKDSGVEWISEIPEGWEICKVKNLCTMQAGKTLSSEEIAREGLYPVYGGNGLRGYYSEYNVDEEVLLIGRQGALCGNVHYAEGKFWATEHAVITRTNDFIDLIYFYFLLMAMNLNQYASNSAAQPGLAVSEIININTVLPSKKEQKSIAKFLDTKCTQIDKLISLKESKIEKLNAYKKSLIYEYVTGKKEA